MISTDPYDVVYRKFERVNGEEKVWWPRVGVAFEREDGGMNVTIDALPVSPNWDGKLFIFPRKKFDESKTQAKTTKKKKPKRYARPNIRKDDTQDDLEF